MSQCKQRLSQINKIFKCIIIIDFLILIRTIPHYSVNNLLATPTSVFLNRCKNAKGKFFFLIRLGPGPNKFTRNYISNFFKFIH